MTALLAILTGAIRPFPIAEGVSAIAKIPTDRPLAVDWFGLEGDEQADKRHHGGPDKAIHHYPHDHYAHWRAALGGHALLDAPGAFGENVSTEGMDEHTVHLGARYRLGTALVEVSHGRQPCSKLAIRFGVPSLTADVVRTGRAGWYYRVLETGTVAPGDRLEPVEPGLADWPLARLFTVLIAGGHKREKAALADLAALPVLAEAWRTRAAELAAAVR